MSTFLKPGAGPRVLGMTRDSDGHRTYRVGFLVASTSKFTGPFEVLNTPGLPQPGNWWLLGDDADPWAWCLPTATVKSAAGDKEPTYYWETEHTFSTKPPPHDSQRPLNNPVGNPLSEKPKVSGASVKYSEEAAYDRFGFPILNSAFEQFKGPKVEFDASRSTVKIEFNVPVLNLSFIDSFLDTLNDDVLWGYPRRCVKLSKRDWDRKYQGPGGVYYSLTLEFDVFVRQDGTSGFDRNILDEGTKALHGQNIGKFWQVTRFNDGSFPDYRNPAHFVQYTDDRGNPGRCILDGFGVPLKKRFTSGGGVNPDSFMMSLTADHTAGDINNPSKWARLLVPPVAPFQVWQPISYPYGAIVDIVSELGTDLWIWPTPGASPATDRPGTGSTTSGWLQVVPNDRGKYVTTGTYAVGDYVNIGGGTIGTGSSTGVDSVAGNIHVEKYDESNMLLLGIPAVL